VPKTLSFSDAQNILHQYVTQENLRSHCLAVSAAMKAMATHFGEPELLWSIVGYLHDVDYERFPETHCQHVKELLGPHDVDNAVIRAIESHGWGICCDVTPENNMEKALFTIDELTGIITAAALMRPTGITDLEPKSVIKKFKDKRFAAKCDRDIILKGCEMLKMELSEVIRLCISGMKEVTDELGLGARNE